MIEPTATGRELWLGAGQELLRRGGVGAVKLRTLTAELGLTTGSFYHHFANMRMYLDDLARFYGADQVRANLELVGDRDPRERLLRLAAMARDRRMVPLDAAMRDWAGSNALAADAVRAADEHLMTFVAAAFVELGFTADQARLRAHLLQAIAVARVIPPWPASGDPAAILRVLAP